MTVLIAFTLFHGILTLIALAIFLFTLAMLYSNFTDSIFVPSRTKTMKEILHHVHPTQGAVFMDIGCGNGKVALYAARTFGVEAIGIDLNPLLITWARISAWMTKTRNAFFFVRNAFKTDISSADYIYVFLLPKFLEQLEPKFSKELKQGCMVISHGFKIKNWDNKLKKTIPGKPFPTYLYAA